MCKYLGRLETHVWKGGEAGVCEYGTWGKFGEDLRAWRAYDVEAQWHIPRANQRLEYPFRARRNSHDPGPQRRVIECDLTPTLAHVRDSNPIQFLHARPGRLHAHAEVKYAREELGWQRGDRREGIAARDQGTSETPVCINVLIGRGKGCGTRCGCLSHGPDLVRSDFEEIE